MSQEKRLSANTPADVGTGVYLARVVGHLDPSFMGGLEVTLLKVDGNTVGDDAQTYQVKYAPPFFGSTGFEFQGLNTDDFNDSQKSYGMWFVPPDVGVTVLVVFVDGNPAEGYWIGCVPSRFANQMTPALAASDAVEFASGDAEKYDVNTIPVAEVNRRANELDTNADVDVIPKAVHPFADHLLEEGLLEDDVRGITSSTGRRNQPSLVFGMSTPGPLDRKAGAKKAYIGKLNNPSPSPVPVSRLGGSQFVMDDGDDRYQRRTTASEGPPDYASLLDGDSGEPEIPKDEYTRLRTRTGHQILLHNSEDLIYIGNSRGTSWIEMSSDGKIDIFAEDSISVHTKQDFNFYADRDFNFEAGRNFNIKVKERFQTEVGGDWNLIVEGDGNIAITGDQNTGITGDHKITTFGDYNLNTFGDNNFQSGGNTNVNVGGDILLTADGSGSFGAADLTFSGGTIDLNGPAAPTAGTAASALPPNPLSTFDLPVIDPSQAGWTGDRYDTQSPVTTILTRVPMHEPWPHHENLDPLNFKPDMTDREGSGPA